MAPEDKNTKNLPNIYTGISGTVRASSVNATNGNYVEIEYGYAFEGAIINTGIYGRYLHLQNAPEVKAGQYVSSSTKLGVMGTTGKSTGVHLHYDISTVPKTNYSDTAMKVFLGNNYAQGSMMNNQEPGVETIATRTVYDPTAFAEQNKQKYKKPRIYW